MYCCLPRRRLLSLPSPSAPGSFQFWGWLAITCVQLKKVFGRPGLLLSTNTLLVLLFCLYVYYYYTHTILSAASAVVICNKIELHTPRRQDNPFMEVDEIIWLRKSDFVLCRQLQHRTVWLSYIHITATYRHVAHCGHYIPGTWLATSKQLASTTKLC